MAFTPVNTDQGTKQKYENLSAERKALQASGALPSWYTTTAWQMFKSKYAVEGENALEGRHRTIARTLSKHMVGSEAEWEEKFFQLMWQGILSPASPVLSNTGTSRGMPVSCSGQYVDDSVDSFYANLHETAMLSKHGFGTSADFSAIRPRGAKISTGGVANGAVEVMDDFFTAASKISQGGSRRGSIGAYLDIEHPDWDEAIDKLIVTPNGKNFGWIIRDSFVEALKQGDAEASRKFEKLVYTKLVTGKGYLFFVDKANRHRPEAYKKHGLDIKASNLCVAPETLVLTRDGNKEISTLVNQEVEVWNGFEWSKVEVIQTGVNRPIISVEVGEKTLSCTAYHKFYVERPSGLIEEVQAVDLQVGDKLMKWNNPDDTALVEDEITGVDIGNRKDNTFCFEEPLRHLGVFNGILTGQCSEIMLHSSPELTYSCILSSLNLFHWDKIVESDAVFTATVFLDCLCSEFLLTSEGIPGLEKVRKFTEKGRAVGLGVMGFHTYLQSKGIPYVGLEAQFLSTNISKHLHDESLRASKWLAEQFGEPEWCEGLGIRNTHRTAMAPTKSSSLLMGGVSESWFPDPGMVFSAGSSIGELNRITPIIYELMKERGVYSEETIQDIISHLGSVQHVNWLSDEEKLVFLNAFEIDQRILFRHAMLRQPFVCQGQSLNFFVPEGGSEDLVSELMSLCFTHPDCLSQYYIYSRSGVVVKDECVSCSG